MSNLFCDKVSLLLPVFNGGDLLLGAIKSIEESGLIFANIFISFNGTDSTDYDNFNRLRDSGELRFTYTTFQTLRNLNAVEHGVFLAEKLRLFIEYDASLFLLAHDDRINTPSNPMSLYAFLEQANLYESVFFPRYDCCIAGNYESVYNIIGSNNCYTPSEFFWFTLENNLATNMSGMIVPFFSWEQAMLACTKATSGARFEHFCCIAQGVKLIRFTTLYSVKVGARINSDGASLSLLQHRKAALTYMLLFAKNHAIGNVYAYLRYSILLAKSFIGYLLSWKPKLR